MTKSIKHHKKYPPLLWCFFWSLTACGSGNESRFRMTWGWVTDDRIFFWGKTISLMAEGSMNFAVNFPFLSLCSESWWWSVGPQWRPRVFSHPEVRSVHRRRRISLHCPQCHRRDVAARVSGSALWVYSICSLISFYHSHVLLDTTLICLRGICLIHSSTAARLQSREHKASQ